jgi:hypothetical protein
LHSTLAWRITKQAINTWHNTRDQDASRDISPQVVTRAGTGAAYACPWGMSSTSPRTTARETTYLMSSRGTLLPLSPYVSVCACMYVCVCMYACVYKPFVTEGGVRSCPSLHSITPYWDNTTHDWGRASHSIKISGHSTRTA